MKRSILACILLSGCVLVLGGCYEPSKVSDQEMDLIAEYAAGILVEHGTDSKEKLLDSAEQEEEFLRLATPTPHPTKVPTALPTKPAGQSPTGEPGATSRPTSAPGPTELSGKELTELFAKEYFSFRYSDFLLTDLYQGDNDLFAAAASGKQLLVMRFEIENTSTGKQTLKLNQGAEKSFVFTLRAGDSSFRPSLTLLGEDMYTAYETEFKAGEKKTGVVVFEVSKDKLPENISLSILKKLNGKEDAWILKIQ